MSIGSSGRIVIEIDPDLKRGLHAALAKEGSTLKQWFVENAKGFVAEAGQLTLDFERGAGRKPDPGGRRH